MKRLLQHSLVLVALGFLVGAAVLAPAHASALPLLSEVFYDAVGSDAPHVFTELVGEPGLALDGWRLVGVNGGTGLPYRTIELTGAVIPMDGVFVIATSRASAALLAHRDFVGDVDWQNGPDIVELWSPLGERADALQYGDTGLPSLGEGRPAADPEAGLALARPVATLDTNDNASDFIAADPTPGLAPMTGPTVAGSEPVSTAWLGLLLIVPSLAARRKARASGSRGAPCER